MKKIEKIMKETFIFTHLVDMILKNSLGLLKNIYPN